MNEEYEEKFKEKYSARWEKDRKTKIRFTHRYNSIPYEVLKSPILEFGPGEGLRQVQCKHKDVFLTADYLGIDLLKPEFPELNIIQGDILDFESGKQFQTIIMIGVLEHISLDQWPLVAEKLKSLCLKGGNVVLFVPHKESIDNYMVYKGDHLVYGITKKFMDYFFPGANISMIYDQRIRYGERFGFLKAAGRFVKSLIFLEKRALKIIPQRVGLLVVWSKE